MRGIFILRNIHVAGLSFNGRQTVCPRQLFEAADRLSCDNTFIGASRGDFNSNPTFFCGRQRDGINSATDLFFEECEINFRCQRQHYAGTDSRCRRLTAGRRPNGWSAQPSSIQPRRKSDARPSVVQALNFIPEFFCHCAIFAPQFFTQKNPVKPSSQKIKQPNPTAQRGREFQLQQARAFKSMSMLASGVAHDFNNVIAGIIGSAEVIKMDVPPDQPDNPILEQIFTAGSRARYIIHQLKIFSQRKACHRTLIQLPPVVGEAVQRLRASVSATVEIVHHLEPECPAVLADAAQIQQAVINLGTNAGHALGNHPGRIEVRLEICDVAADLAVAHPDLSAGTHVRLSVRDNGHPISKSVLERMFEPFACKQIDGHDSGLELFTVQEIVHAHEGAITVDSAAGEGTVFRLYFPVPGNEDGENPFVG